MKAVFLDRDGVINKYPGDFEYVKSWREFHFLPKAAKGLKRLNQAGFRLFIISNQAGVSKGLYSHETLNLITENMLEALGKKGVVIDGIYYCTHRSEDSCACRKPKTGLIDMALTKARAKGFDIELSKSYLIGDSIKDVETGKSLGIKTILVFSGKEKLKDKTKWQAPPDFTAKDLSDAVELILVHNRRGGLNLPYGCGQLK